MTQSGLAVARACTHKSDGFATIDAATKEQRVPKPGGKLRRRGRCCRELFLFTFGGDKTRTYPVLLDVLPDERAGWPLPPLLQRVHAVELNDDVPVFRRNTHQ